jgi:TetR/AcrR family transcriptional regulator
MHLFILLWGSTQFYADFDAMVENMLDTKRLTRRQLSLAADTIVHVVLQGCGVRGDRRSPARGNARPKSSAAAP